MPMAATLRRHAHRRFQQMKLVPQKRRAQVAPVDDSTIIIRTRERAPSPKKPPNPAQKPRTKSEEIGKQGKKEKEMKTQRTARARSCMPPKLRLQWAELPVRKRWEEESSAADNNPSASSPSPYEDVWYGTRRSATGAGGQAAHARGERERFDRIGTGRGGIGRRGRGAFLGQEGEAARRGRRGAARSAIL
ncbi:hypothetical protein C8J57DRAFT_1242127 [Mycena rebaudengoi]|nr:hypothetical protein C8J57DRAFT_1242127 [Mycena rebaudengoi]